MIRLNRFKKLLQYLTVIVLYVSGMNLFLYLKMLGLAEYKGITEAEQQTFILLSGLMAFFVALIIGLLELKLFIRWKHFSLFKFMIFKYGIIVATIISCGVVLYCVSAAQVQNLTVVQAIENVPGFLGSETFLSVSIYLLIFSIMLNALRVVSEHLGPEAFWAAMVGKYNLPMEEDRTFIFLDLEASTTIAEKLGHTQYSLFIKECFQMLTKYIHKYDAVLYQFVGDEAVLSWKTSTVLETLDPIRLYFDFSDHLRNEGERLLMEYGVTAKFKAAIHTGLVTVTKIQSTKSDIVYHGDVLNTCARIMEQCSRLKKDLLVSIGVAYWIMNDPDFHVSFMEQLTLRGKEKKTSVYSVSDKLAP